MRDMRRLAAAYVRGYEKKNNIRIPDGLTDTPID